ncbi:MAG TPA: PHP domain-containing protein [Candidatus Latescibacteria bacterium]|nr:PHP domain-containing protein [Candidatus Latescibacterota bacterium]
MGCPRYDFHIHTKYLGCANSTMEVPAIVEECRRLGATKIGITDHLNSLDKLEFHLHIRRDIEELEDIGVAVYFGVELNFTGCDGEFAFSRRIKEEYGFQFAIGGIHSTYLEEYDVRKLVEVQHRHHIRTCQDPLVQVLVHPYWFSKGEFDRNGWPWFNFMRVVPESYVRELGQASRETGTAIEINGTANLMNPNFGEDYFKEYKDFLSILAEEGAMFSLGSDAHDIGHLKAVREVWRVVEELGIPEDRIWSPGCGPMAGR